MLLQSCWLGNGHIFKKAYVSAFLWSNFNFCNLLFEGIIRFSPTALYNFSLLNFFLVLLTKSIKPTIVFCCYNCLDLLWEKFFKVWVTCFPSSWEQNHSVEKRLCKFEAVGWEFVTFLRHCSCLRVEPGTFRSSVTLSQLGLLKFVRYICRILFLATVLPAIFFFSLIT